MSKLPVWGEKPTFLQRVALAFKKKKKVRPSQWHLLLTQKDKFIGNEMVCFKTDKPKFTIILEMGMDVTGLFYVLGEGFSKQFLVSKGAMLTFKHDPGWIHFICEDGSSFKIKDIKQETENE